MATAGPAPSNVREFAAPDIINDTVPKHRKLAGDFFLRIGDTQFIVPPEFIRVSRDGVIFREGAIRQIEPLKFKNGQSTTMIEIQLWFTNLEQINGIKVEGPISGQHYFMDGLRPLLAQLKRMPFLPIVNEFLNEVMDIHTVAFSNVTFSTVEGFPDVIQATLTLQKMDVTPYIQKPSWTYDQHFIYPLFRWYYNQMLVETKPTNSSLYMKPIYNESFTDKFVFKILNEAFLHEQKENHTLKSLELDKIAFDVVDMPNDIYCTSIMGSFGTYLSQMQMDFRENPTFQYIGSMDTNFQVRFETRNRDAVAVLERLFTTVEGYSRMFRDRIVTGYVQVENSVLNMAGVYNVMIQDMTVATVPGFPDLFSISMTLTSYHDTQYQDQRVYAHSMIDTAGASKAAIKNVGDAKEYLYTKQEPWFLVEEGIAEGILDTIELYPDLELPTYAMLNDALAKINTFRKNKGHTPLPITEYKPPKHMYRNYGEEVYTHYELTPEATFVEPDFYFTYPKWEQIRGVDMESANMEAIASLNGIADGFTKKTSMGIATETTTYATNQSSRSVAPVTNDGSTASIIWNFFRSKGFSEAATAGIMGNLQQESTLDPTYRQKGGKGIGLAQWTDGGRWKSLTTWAGIRNKDPWKATTQLEYIWEELNGADSTTVQKLKGFGGLEALMKETNINKAVEIFEKSFTRAGKPLYEKRYQYARDHYAKFTGTAVSEVPESAGGPATNASGPSHIVEISEALLQYAEADILAPIPKNGEEELEIRSESDNPNALIRAMVHDQRKYSKRGSMIRAFPTFTLAFIDEGRFVDYRRMWNNYYLYHAVKDISLVKERTQPVDTLTIQLVNIYGALNASTRPLTKAVTQDARYPFPGWGNTLKHPWSSFKWYWHHWFPSVNDDMVKHRLMQTQTSGFELRTGARVHLRMGYGSVASMMPIVFNGRITEMDSMDTVQIICQSDALELINPYHEWAGDSRTTWWNFRQEAKDIIDNLLVNREGADWLLNFDGIFGTMRNGGVQSKFGIEHFGYVIGKDHALYDVFSIVGNMWNAVLGQETVNGYDARKNIYSSTSDGTFGDTETLDNTPDETNVHFWQTNKSPWDVMQILTAIAPDYELKVHEHGFHSTVFYGQPQWYVKYAYRNTSSDPKDISSYKEVLKVSQQYHSIDSMQDIISNGTKASGRDICTVAIPIYSFDEKPKAAETLYADYYIKPELQRTEIVDTSLLQDFPMGDWIAEAVRWTGYQVTDMTSAVGGMLASIPGLGDDNIIKKFGEWLADIKVDRYSRTERLAIEAAKTHVQWKFREMYKGDIIILGDSAIRPGDMLNVCDTYTQMFGQVEVGRIVHVMSMQEGFVSAIKPDLLAVRKDGKRIRYLNAWANLGTHHALLASAALMRAYIKKNPKKSLTAIANGFTKATKFIRGLRAARTGLAVGGVAGAVAAMGPFALGVVIFELALWTITGLIIDAIEALIVKQSAGVAIMPLWYKNRPYVAGIDGHRDLIPGYWDENYWGPVENYTPPTIEGGSSFITDGGSNTTGAFVPDGRTYCYPAPSQIVTSVFGIMRTIEGVTARHQGVDYAATIRGVDGDPIYAIAGGTVVFSGIDRTAGRGEYIIIDHGDRYSLYAHLSARLVEKGMTVEIGKIIGRMGNTGKSTGTHLHFEVRPKDGATYYQCTPIDGDQFLKTNNAYKVPKSDSTRMR